MHWQLSFCSFCWYYNQQSKIIIMIFIIIFTLNLILGVWHGLFGKIKDLTVVVIRFHIYFYNNFLCIFLVFLFRYFNRHFSPLSTYESNKSEIISGVTNTIVLFLQVIRERQVYNARALRLSCKIFIHSG